MSKIESAVSGRSCTLLVETQQQPGAAASPAGHKSKELAVSREESFPNESTREVLVLLPAHDEESSIGGVLEELRRLAPTFDRLVINDGSTDATSAVVERLGERELRLPFNLGYGGALQVGLRYALASGYEIVVFLDADGQHRPKDVPRLVAALQMGRADVVIGSRYVSGGSYDGALGRRIGQRLFSFFSSTVTARRIWDTTSGLKAMKRCAYGPLTTGTFLDFHVEALVKWSLLGLSVEEIPVVVRRREHGSSMHGWGSALGYPLKTLLLTLVAATDVWIGEDR